MTRRPQGLDLAALCAALFGAAAAATALVVEPWTLAPWKALVVRAAVALLAVLSGVAAEALLHARPWAPRATHALAVAWVSMLTPLFVWLGGSPDSYWTLVCGGLVLVPLLLHVRRHTAGALQQRSRRVPGPWRP
jgi:hypothetical protein